MKHPLLKPVLMAALCVCIAITLFSTFSPARTAHANRVAAQCYGATNNIGLGHMWYPGYHVYAATTACDQLDLTYQTDGNFVLYHSGHAIWATDTTTAWWFAKYPDYTQFQTDGNLVVYETDASDPFPSWASNTSGQGATTLALQSDGNLVIYRNGTPLWASNTNFY